MKLATMTCLSRIENLDEVTGFVGKCADNFGLDQKRKFGLMVAIEEAFVNVCHYSYPAGEGEVELDCGSEEASFVVEIKDRGAEFNILTLPEPDTTSEIMDREIGGLGVFFIRKLTDDLTYRRDNNRNILRMVLHLNEDASS